MLLHDLKDEILVSYIYIHFPKCVSIGPDSGVSVYDVSYVYLSEPQARFIHLLNRSEAYLLWMVSYEKL